ncbi:MAG: TMEM14 family protein [Chlamydiales bacterium]|nr:TMEM14 family protein [Chlamydiales bacterium]
MRTVGVIIILFGLLVGLGGLIGYIQANSMVSLVMGFGFGVALIVSGCVMVAGKLWGQNTALVLSISLAVFFGLRFLSSKKVMPAGLILVLSLIAIMSILINFEKRR